ncbi:hypothetical protein IG631_10839 [Alternaria alternata]|nr:hypothetical protein IG631_10839 [Alternaria alternata]
MAELYRARSVLEVIGSEVLFYIQISRSCASVESAGAGTSLHKAETGHSTTPTKLTKPRKDAIARRGTYAVHRACREKSDPITAAEDALPSAGHPIREVWETRWHTEYPAEEVEAVKRRFAKS